MARSLPQPRPGTEAQSGAKGRKGNGATRLKTRQWRSCGRRGRGRRRVPFPPCGSWGRARRRTWPHPEDGGGHGQPLLAGGDADDLDLARDEQLGGAALGEEAFQDGLRVDPHLRAVLHHLQGGAELEPAFGVAVADRGEKIKGVHGRCSSCWRLRFGGALRLPRALAADRGADRRGDRRDRPARERPLHRAARLLEGRLERGGDVAPDGAGRGGRVRGGVRFQC